MIVRLQSSEQFTHCALLDPVSGAVQMQDIRKEGHVFDGLYCEGRGGMLAIFAWRGTVNVLVSGKVVTLDHRHTAEAVDMGAHSRLRLLENGRLLALHDYTPEIRADGDMTPFLEDEDFDFGLFVANVANVANSTERRRNFVAAGCSVGA